MNQEEALKIVTVLNRAGLLWAMEGQAAVWAMALEDVSFATAQEVVRDMTANRTSTKRSVTPGDIREAVRIIRADRLGRMVTPQPPTELDGNPAREIPWARAYRAAIGDGLNETQATRKADKTLGVARTQLDTKPCNETLRKGVEPVRAELRRLVRPEHGPNWKPPATT